MTSKHYTKDRKAREAIIRQIGMGDIKDRFVVDRGHKNGAEIHEIRTTGIIVIYNQHTGEMITKLIARVGQIKRYYENKKAPKEILARAYENTVVNHYNRI